jgi:hypothetical protein
MNHLSFLRKLGWPKAKVTSECEAAILLGDTLYIPALVMFRYTAKEPFAVRMTVRIPGSGPSEWIFGRDLLIDGVNGPTGLGTVRVWPATQSTGLPGVGNDTILFRIGVPGAEATLATPAVVVRDFLERSKKAVATGTEGDLLRLDEDIFRLMGGRAA